MPFIVRRVLRLRVHRPEALSDYIEQRDTPPSHVCSNVV